MPGVAGDLPIAAQHLRPAPPQSLKVGKGDDRIFVGVVAPLDRGHGSLGVQPGDPGGRLAGPELGDPLDHSRRLCVGKAVALPKNGGNVPAVRGPGRSDEEVDLETAGPEDGRIELVERAVRAADQEDTGLAVLVGWCVGGREGEGMEQRCGSRGCTCQSPEGVFGGIECVVQGHHCPAPPPFLTVFWIPSISLSSWLSARSSTPVELPELPRFRASESISSMKMADGL